MTSSRPYLFRAIYEWLLDNGMTPYIMVNAMMERVEVPIRFVENGSIILNIAPQAVAGMTMNNNFLEFDARFSGIREHIYVPIEAVCAVYAYENGRGMVFNEEEENIGKRSPSGAPEESPKDDDPSNGSKKPPRRGKPKLKVVK
ncbi:MAG TPA: ClpXP protease specificity-enhancing factor [Coxiellaceae bacterium]|nr:ClpXP protease specificity-enhancing factor [Coxiellaceae bacterium]